MQRLLLTLTILAFSWSYVQSQALLQQKVAYEGEGVTLQEALNTMGRENGIRFAFSEGLIAEERMDVAFDSLPLADALPILLQGTPLSFKAVGGQVVIYLPAASRFSISGVLRDARNGEPLIGANVLEQRSGLGTSTNEYGFFSLSLPYGAVELLCSYVGYQAEERAFALQKDTRMDMALKPELTLSEVEVIGQRSLSAVLSSQEADGSGKVLSAQRVQQLPALAGESDVVRALHLLPGVQTGTDGIGGMHVRGGNDGQNLIMIDGVPVYNISHAAGLFSIFNTNAVRTATLYRGHFPARFGGRLSSVLDIRTKDGNKHEYHAQGDIGLLSARFTAEGPIIKDKSSFIISARKSLINWYLNPLAASLQSTPEERRLSYDFYDLNAKLDLQLSSKDRLYVSVYQGRDHYQNSGLSTDTLSIFDASVSEPAYFISREQFNDRMEWANRVSSLQWTHLFGDRLFTRFTASHSALDLGIGYVDADSLLALSTQSLTDRRVDIGDYQSKIKDFSLRLDADYRVQPGYTMRFGWNLTQHFITPGVLDLQVVEKADTVVNAPRLSGREVAATEYAAYMEHISELGRGFTLNAGLYGALFSVEKQHYASVQPRLSLSWAPSSQFTVRGYGGRMAQFLHLLSNTALGLPASIWVPSTARIRPQQSWHTGAAFHWRFKEGWQLSGDLYYKNMRHLLTYSEGAQLINDWESNVAFGKGEAYGMELVLEKAKGLTTGWLSYGLAWANRQYDRINNGVAYPYRYDRRHSLKVAAVHRFADWLEASASWSFSTGLAFSLPQGQYTVFVPGVGPVNAVDYGFKNDFRMPYDHRLDLGLNMYIETGRVRHKINLSVYNAYNRSNPLYYDLRVRYVSDGAAIEQQRSFTPVTLIPFMPAFNYAIRF